MLRVAVRRLLATFDHLHRGIVAADKVVDFMENLVCCLDHVRTGYPLFFTCVLGCLTAGALALLSQTVLGAHGLGLHVDFIYLKFNS